MSVAEISIIYLMFLQITSLDSGPPHAKVYEFSPNFDDVMDFTNN